ncbi:hypothetical protein ES705_21227 [subsurface metagenome]
MQVIEEEAILLDVKLTPTTTELEEVVVSTKFRQKTETALLRVKSKSATLMDGISSQHISRMGDSDAAVALGRVTGLSVEGGKIVYVRGLSDRYSKITLNSAVLPGLDPNRNTIQMDVFPTILIESMVVNKTFSADLPGDFTGGHIDITTKEYPENFTLTFSTTIGFNPQANLNNEYLSYEGGKLDWLGIDNGTRVKPEEASDVPYYSNSAKPELTKITLAFNKIMGPGTKKSFLNHSHSFSIGNQINLFGKPFGFLTGVYYSRKYNYYDDGIIGWYKLPGSNENYLNTEHSYTDAKSNTDVLIGGIVNMHYKLAKNHKIGLNIIRNQNGENIARYMYGEKQSDEIGTYSETRTLKFIQRALTTWQLIGEHNFESLANIKVNWLSSYTLSQQNEPDLRFFTNRHLPEFAGTDAEYEISPSKHKVPTRLYRNLWENNFNNKLDITIPFKYHAYSAEFKLGTSYEYKFREFSEERFDYIRQYDNYYGSVADYLRDESIGLNDKVYGFGLYMQDVTDTKNSYNANQTIIAYYAMVNLPLFQRLRVIAGVRFEKTDIFSRSKNDDYDPGELDELDVLPSLNFNYTIKDNMNMRMVYTRTLARPTFREIAPFASEDFQGGEITVGNPELQRSFIDNMDVRWEYFMKPGEIISFSVFYKHFILPIEKVQDPRAPNPQISWNNVDNAEVIGFEVEMRKEMDFLNLLRNVTLGSNFTYLNSYVSIDSIELDAIKQVFPDHNGKRAMYGQTPYILNSYISYKNDDIGISANLAYNISGEKLVLVMKAPTPNVFEQPNGQVNFNISKEFGKKERISVKFSINNILNSSYKKTCFYNNREYIFSEYTKGRTFSFGVTYLVN